jgi:hypothetical protein
VDPVPDPLLLRKPGSAGNRTRTSGSVARNSDHYTTEAVILVYVCAVYSEAAVSVVSYTVYSDLIVNTEFKTRLWAVVPLYENRPANEPGNSNDVIIQFEMITQAQEFLLACLPREINYSRGSRDGNKNKRIGGFEFFNWLGSDVFLTRSFLNFN